MSQPAPRRRAGFGAAEGTCASRLARGGRFAASRQDLRARIDQGRAISFARMHDMAGRVGAALRARGIGANDRVALLSGNSLEHLIVYLGTMCHGATICTVQVDMNRAHLDEILRALDPALTLHEDALGLEAPGRVRARRVAGARAVGRRRGNGFLRRARPDARRAARPRSTPMATWPRSSTPPAPPPSPRAWSAPSPSCWRTSSPPRTPSGSAKSDRVLDFRSYNWMSAQVLSFLGPLLRGATLYMARRFSQSRYFDWIREFDITVAACNPTAINMLVNRPIAISAPTCRISATSPRARPR